MFTYNEDKHMQVVHDHIASTYGQHYVSDGPKTVDGRPLRPVQVQDILIASGHAESFYVGNAIKYLARYGKKDGKNSKDILKAIHYMILLLDLNHPEDINKYA